MRGEKEFKRCKKKSFEGGMEVWGVVSEVHRRFIFFESLVPVFTTATVTTTTKNLT